MTDQGVTGHAKPSQKMIPLYYAQLYMFTTYVLGWMLWIFDNATGVRLIQEGKIATFIQATRSKNSFLILWFMISGRQLSDCIFLTLASFLLPWYINGATALSFYLSFCVFFELYFEEECKTHIALRFPNTIWLLTTGARIGLLWILNDAPLNVQTTQKNEEVFNRLLLQPFIR